MRENASRGGKASGLLRKKKAEGKPWRAPVQALAKSAWGKNPNQSVSGVVKSILTTKWQSEWGTVSERTLWSFISLLHPAKIENSSQ
jgi:hypothetical protein